MPEKPEKLEVRLVVRPCSDRSVAWSQLWTWLLQPGLDMVNREASQWPVEGDTETHCGPDRDQPRGSTDEVQRAC
jgi:hypothetical protein